MSKQKTMATDLGFYRAKIKIYGFLPVLRLLEYFSSCENYHECAFISNAIDEHNKKRPPSAIKIPKNIDDEILDYVLKTKQHADSEFDMLDLLELIEEGFEKILIDSVKENKMQSLN